MIRCDGVVTGYDAQTGARQSQALGRTDDTIYLHVDDAPDTANASAIAFALDGTVRWQVAETAVYLPVS